FGEISAGDTWRPDSVRSTVNVAPFVTVFVPAVAVAASVYCPSGRTWPGQEKLSLPAGSCSSRTVATGLPVASSTAAVTVDGMPRVSDTVTRSPLPSTAGVTTCGWTARFVSENVCLGGGGADGGAGGPELPIFPVAA